MLYSFCSLAKCIDGAEPVAGLTFDARGSLYGTTYGGGSHCLPGGCGVVFKLAKNADGSWSEAVLHSFCGSNCGRGQYPSCKVVFDREGNLYGTTAGGGAGGGTVFQLTPKSDGSWSEKDLHYFTGGNDGANPVAGLIVDTAGNLYGTASGGGSHGSGVAVELSPDAKGSWKEKVLHSFWYNGRDGAGPLASLIVDASGSLYGTTSGGGTAKLGTVFKLTPGAGGNWTESILQDFAGLDSGYDPVADLILDSAGNLYGTTLGGGGGYGLVFKLASKPKGRWKETMLRQFFDRPGAYPRAGVILDSAGNLYGTTSGDNTTNFGSVFEITP